MAPLAAALLVTLAAGSACRSVAQDAPVVTQPGAPGQPSRVITPAEAVHLSQVQITQDDVQFMQGMIAHHRQAIEMTDLLVTRTSREDMKRLGLRIALSQQDEIKTMERWLQARRQLVPAHAAAHQHGARLMPGMLTEDDMSRLAAATGVDFDRLFLEGMITHHRGALTMVEQLFEKPDAGEDSDIFAFASDVDVDQRIEIERMSAMLGEIKR